MKRSVAFTIMALTCLFPACAFSASSLDELYRDIIRSDNRGYLPLFVKNRTVPGDILIDEESISSLKHAEPSVISSGNSSVNLSNDYNKDSVLAKARQQQWLKTVAAVKSNQITPFELNDITSRVQQNDPKATEILAWMYTKGIGVTTNFVTAFNLYKKAAALNVANAEKNALAVYKSMSEDERRQIKNHN